MTIGVSASVGSRPHRMTLQNPGDEVPDGSGGFSRVWTDAQPPTLYMQIQPAAFSSQQYRAGVALFTQATHVITGPYHPQISTRSRLLFDNRTFTVAGIMNRDERNQEMVLFCTELLS